MQTNKVKHKIAQGETANGFIINWPSSELVEFYGHLGFDFAWIDCEHGYIGLEKVAEMCRACELTGMAPFVRVPENNAATILGYLECGAMGIIVPHVSTGEAARAAADAVRYTPLGNRGGFSSSRPANYGVTQTTAEYYERINAELLVYVMIEDMEGVENLDDILAVEGVDVVAFGPGDFAMSMGYPGQLNHPEVKKVREAAQARIDAVKPTNLRVAGVGALAGVGARQFLAGESL
jgi:4-hydroxy-2-oxoheptanedioate aldolase